MTLLDKIASIEEKYTDLTKSIEESVEDYQKVAEYAKERAELEPIVTLARKYRQISQRISEAESLKDSEDQDLRELAALELEELHPQLEKINADLKNHLIPKDPRDRRNVIMEIRAGTGGEEAALFAADLFRLYSKYTEKNGWSIEILSENTTGIGGYKEIIFLVKGRGAYSRLKFESGVHRVQRIPATESSGRIHTSTITVAVLAEVEEVDIHIPDSDLRIDIYKSAGAGGQNVQKNATAIRITHIPTGIVVACQDERSQLQNRLRAMRILRAKLYEIEEEKRQREQEESRRSQVGTGERSEKIRTYNYPQSRVTDYRINLSSFNIAGIMEGDLDFFIDELSVQEEADRLGTTGEDDSD